MWEGKTFPPCDAARCGEETWSSRCSTRLGSRRNTWCVRNHSKVIQCSLLNARLSAWSTVRLVSPPRKPRGAGVVLATVVVANPPHTPQRCSGKNKRQAMLTTDVNFQQHTNAQTLRGRTRRYYSTVQQLYACPFQCIHDSTQSLDSAQNAKMPKPQCLASNVPYNKCQTLVPSRSNNDDD